MLFISFGELAQFIREVKPAGSFSTRVKLHICEGQPIRNVQWIKAKQVRDLRGRFMTWANTGGCVTW